MSEIKNNGAIDSLTGNINDAIWAMGQFGQFTIGVLLDKDKVIHMIGVGDVSKVFVSVVLVGKSLMALAERVPMSHV